MNGKKILLILIIILTLSGCVNIKDLSYDDIVNNIATTPKRTNTYNKGYQFYTPKGLAVKEMGANYAILSGNDIDYYLYVDLVSYNKKKEINYEINNKAIYSENINYEGKTGYVEIILWENNKYLIEIMYNYAKIEVMVDKELINKALINSVNILNSIKYNDTIIENLLNDDNLTYTEEIFDMFKDVKNNSSILDYGDGEIPEDEDTEKIKDTDFLN